MKRRQLIRDVASASMVTMVGASAAAGATTADSPAEEPYLAMRQPDGSYEVVERGGLDVEPDCIPKCSAWFCCDCTCDCCQCTVSCSP